MLIFKDNSDANYSLIWKEMIVYERMGKKSF